MYLCIYIYLYILFHACQESRLGVGWESRDNAEENFTKVVGLVLEKIY